MRKISFSILKENKEFSLALFVMYIQVVALLVMSLFLSKSFDKTIKDYFNEYNVYDIYVVTQGIPDSMMDEIKNIDGVSDVDGRLFSNIVVALENTKRLSVGGYTISADNSFKSMNIETGKILKTKSDTVAVSSYFARKNNIAKGSKIKVKCFTGFKEYEVTDIISSPETMAVGLTPGAWYSGIDYGNIYFSEELAGEIFGVSGLYNNFRILVDDGADIEKIKSDIKDVVGKENILEMQEFDGSPVDVQVSASIDSVKNLTTYLPIAIAGIGLLFSSVFVGQVVRNSRKNIGLLRAIGYTKGKVQFIFVLYVLFISSFATVFGTALGAILLRVMLEMYKSFYDFPYVRFSINIPVAILVLAGVNALSVISSLTSSGEINRIEPALAYGGEELETVEIPRAIEKIKCDPFTKLTINMIYRNRKRVIATFACTLACMWLTMLSLSVLLTKNEAIRYTFDDRYNYDIAVYTTDSNELSQIAESKYLENVKTASQFDTIYEEEPLRLETKEELSNKNEIYLEEGFARRHHLNVGDEMTVEGTKLTVAGITRQYLCTTQYVSMDTMVDMGYYENVLVANLKNHKDEDKFLEDASNYPHFLQALVFSDTRTSVEEVMNQIDLPVYIFTVFAMLLGFIIMYNMSLISFLKRKRELATLRAIGTQNGKIFKLLFGESMVEYIAACILAPLGFLITKFIFLKMSSISEEYVLVHMLAVLLTTYGLTFIYTLGGVMATFRNVKKMDFVLELSKRE